MSENLPPDAVEAAGAIATHLNKKSSLAAARYLRTGNQDAEGLLLDEAARMPGAIIVEVSATPTTESSAEVVPRHKRVFGGKAEPISPEDSSTRVSTHSRLYKDKIEEIEE